MVTNNPQAARIGQASRHRPRGPKRGKRARQPLRAPADRRSRHTRRRGRQRPRAQRTLRWNPPPTEAYPSLSAETAPGPTRSACTW